MARIVSPKAALEWVLIAAFLVGIASPGIGMLLGRRDDSSATGETLAAPPPWPRNARDALDAAGKFKVWFRDRFAFRQSLVRWHGIVSFKLFHTATDRRVMPGRDGWLFYVEDPGQLLRSTQPLSEAEVERWADALEAWNRELAARGVNFVCVFPPDKQTIYPESIPAWVPRAATSPAGQVVARLKERGHVAVVDVRAEMSARRGDTPLYYRTDTHWNEYGAFLGWRAIASTLSRWYPVRVPRNDEVTVEHWRGNGGDMARLLGLQGELDDELFRVRPQPLATFVGGSTEHDAPLPVKGHDLLVTERKGAPIPRAVVFLDSFFGALLPHAAEVFGHALYLWDMPKLAIVAREQPDLVMFQLVERTLRWGPPQLDRWPELRTVQSAAAAASQHSTP